MHTAANSPTPQLRHATIPFTERFNGKRFSQTPLPNPSLPNAYFGRRLPSPLPDNFVFNGDCEKFLAHAKQIGKTFDLVFTSPPYNLDKPYSGYADDRDLDEYLKWQERIITACVERLTPTGSICWQVGNYVSNGHILPLDLEIGPIFKKLGLKLRNRIVWNFGHGLHCKRRFSGRYEVVLWYSKTDAYKFNLDAIRIPSKYPNKKHFKGPRKGELFESPVRRDLSAVCKWRIAASSTHVRLTYERAEGTFRPRHLRKRERTDQRTLERGNGCLGGGLTRMQTC